MMRVTIADTTDATTKNVRNQQTHFKVFYNRTITAKNEDKYITNNINQR